MAIISCPECNKEISSKAVFCPHCGCPINENKQETVYEIEKGTTAKSGLATFFSVLAWITWIGGLIISVAGAIVTVSGYYRDKTEFSFGTFLTLLIPFVIYGALLMGMSTLVQQIADTHAMVKGMRLIKKDVRQAPSSAGKKHVSEPSVVSTALSNIQSDWQVDGSGFYVCPKCGMKCGPSVLINKKKCPGCEYEFKSIASEDNSSEQEGYVGSKDEYGWIIDGRPGFVRCPSCDRCVSSDYMKYRKACSECGYEHIKKG